MIKSDRREERAVIDVLNKKPAKIVAHQIQASDIGYYVAIATKESIRITKLMTFYVKAIGGSINVTINDTIEINGTDTIWLYTKPFKINDTGIEVTS